MTGSLYRRDQAAISSLAQLRFYPLAARSGSGSWLITEDGDRVLDLTGGLGAAGLGFAHPAVVSAVERAVRTMPGVSMLSGTHEPAVALAEGLLAALPGNGDRKVYLGHAGTDANTAALRAARAATGRTKIITFGGSYHGGLGEAQGVSGLYVADGVPADPGLISVPYPDPYRPEPITGSASSSPEEMLSATLARVEQALAGDDVALLLVEPVSNDAGVLVPPDGFLSGLRRLCDRFGVLLGSDEVKVGLGRTGTFLATGVEQVVPDVITLGKTLGGGLPLSAAILPAEIADSSPAGLLLTTVGNPVSAAAGLAVINTIMTEHLWQNAAEVGDHLLKLLDQLQDRHPIIGQVRGRGLTIGLELVQDHQSRKPAARETALIVYRAFELGVATDYCGAGSNVIELTPPLILTRTDAEWAVERLDRAFTDVAAGLVPDAAVAAYGGW